MADLAVACRRCRKHFLVPNLIGGHGGILIMRGNTTACPECGGPAEILDGDFELKNDRMIFLGGPPATKVILEGLEQIAAKARAEDLTAEEILAEVADISPELTKKLTSKKLGPAILILVLLLLVRSCSLDITVDVNELIDQATGAAETQEVERLYDDLPPIPALDGHEPSNPTLAMQSPAKESRQVRRQRERQAKKRERKI